jgi:hypothetical protein
MALIRFLILLGEKSAAFLANFYYLSFSQAGEGGAKESSVSGELTCSYCNKISFERWPPAIDPVASCRGLIYQTLKGAMNCAPAWEWG